MTPYFIAQLIVRAHDFWEINFKSDNDYRLSYHRLILYVPYVYSQGMLSDTFQRICLKHRLQWTVKVNKHNINY